MPAIGTSPTVVTVAIRSPLMITGQGERQLDAPELLPARVAHRRRRLADRRGNAVDAGHDAAEQDLQRVAHERDLRGERREPGDRRQQDEQRQARDRVHDPERAR